MKGPIRVFTLISLCAGIAMANEDLRFADSCYAARAERSVEDKADVENAKKMIAAYKRAQSDPEVAEEATAGFVRSLYFAFRFVPFDKKLRSSRLDSLKSVSEAAYNKYPKNKEIAHIYVSALSMWGAERGPLTSVKEGVAVKVRDIASAPATALCTHRPVVARQGACRKIPGNGAGAGSQGPLQLLFPCRIALRPEALRRCAQHH